MENEMLEDVGRLKPSLIPVLDIHIIPDMI